MAYTENQLILDCMEQSTSTLGFNIQNFSGAK